MRQAAQEDPTLRADRGSKVIEKPAIIVTSTGRTGTEFFARLFADVIPDCTSLHEPDIIKFTGVRHRLSHYREQLRTSGAWRLIVLKALGKWTVVKLSDARFVGLRDRDWAARSLLAQRYSFVSELPGSIYAESNLGFYGLLDVIPRVFAHSRAIYVIRDGRDWVRSAVNWGEIYQKKGLRKYFSHQWPGARDVPGDSLANEWDGLPRFTRLCWAWAKMNEFALGGVAENPHARVFHFERLFSGEDRYRYLSELLNFITPLPGLSRDRIASTSGRLERRVHESSARFPAWDGWSPDQKATFIRICGPLMEQLGYTI